MLRSLASRQWGFEVPNRERETVFLKEVMSSKAAREADFHLPLFIGKDAAGDALLEDLARMPHLLIAGSDRIG